MDWWLQMAAVALGSGGAATIATALITRDTARHSTDRTVDADLQKHWSDTMGELVDTLRDELHDAREKVADYLELKERLAHLEEALDHIHALLNAEGAAEIKAAERRARAFLKRMRPDPDQVKGEMAQSVQRAVSARRIVRDADEGKID